MRTKTSSLQDSTARVIPNMPWRVLEVLPLNNYCLKVHFIDGTEGLVKMAGLITGLRSGVFSALRDEAVFNKVFVNLGAVAWPGEIDLAPDAMYDAIKKQGEWVLS